MRVAVLLGLLDGAVVVLQRLLEVAKGRVGITGHVVGQT